MPLQAMRESVLIGYRSGNRRQEFEMATILAHIQVHPGCEREFEAVSCELFGASQAETGMRRYEYWRGATHGLYYCLLAFDDFYAFLAHQTSDHHEAASPTIGDLVSNLRLEWVDPVQGASDLPPTEAQPLPSNADELTERYHKLFSPTHQAWWDPLRSR
jgi:quinol monooxygenase YgiN